MNSSRRAFYPAKRLTQPFSARPRLTLPCPPSRVRHCSEHAERTAAMKAFAFRTAGTLVGIVTLVVATLCSAAEYPARPVRVIAPYAPGGGVDFTSPVARQKLPRRSGQ